MSEKCTTLLASVSFIAAPDPATRQRVLGEVRALVAATPALANKVGVSVPYHTHVWWTKAV